MINTETGRGVMASVGLTVLAYLVMSILYDVCTQIGLISVHNLSDDFGERTLGILAIGCNIFLIQYFRKRVLFDRMQGVVIATFVFIAIWFFFFRHIIL